ncbi:hypothetical protein DPMN_164331 [Dreissena polymorpha]|uniref:Uncharacterized protein n=1 Tax=Dreissena polymorpha TaxID=45954 RepID=A0A9D4EUY2_DREPO|nr:hypothetical protein DPMN_164331 [Dreissena polymorpha]
MFPGCELDGLLIKEQNPKSRDVLGRKAKYGAEKECFLTYCTLWDIGAEAAKLVIIRQTVAHLNKLWTKPFVFKCLLRLGKRRQKILNLIQDVLVLRDELIKTRPKVLKSIDNVNERRFGKLCTKSVGLHIRDSPGENTEPST